MIYLQKEECCFFIEKTPSIIHNFVYRSIVVNYSLQQCYVTQGLKLYTYFLSVLNHQEHLYLKNGLVSSFCLMPSSLCWSILRFRWKEQQLQGACTSRCAYRDIRRKPKPMSTCKHLVHVTSTNIPLAKVSRLSTPNTYSVKDTFSHFNGKYSKSPAKKVWTQVESEAIEQQYSLPKEGYLEYSRQ